MEEKRKNNSQLELICYHCGLPAKSTYKAIIEDKEQNFCCQGCITACNLIYSSGASSYYKNRDGYCQLPVKSDIENINYNSENFFKDFIKKRNNNFSIKFYVEAIHCPSCMWVIEKVLAKELNIKDVQVNFTSKTVKVNWDDTKTDLNDIVNLLTNIGYKPQPVEKVNIQDKITESNRDLLLKMTVAGFGTLSTMFLSEPFYFKYVQDLNPESARLLKLISLIITTPIYFYCIKPFFKSTASAIKYRVFSMDFNIFIGATLIYIYSVLAVFMSNSQIYFDCLTMFLFLIIVGRYVEATVKERIFIKVNQSIKNYSKQSILVKDGIEKIIYSKDIKIDDVILIKVGEQIPIDGEIIYGSGYINESVMTGESKPLYKTVKDKVIAGSINIEGAFYIRAEKIGSDTALNQIIDLSESISSSKNKINLFTDKASHYLITISLISAIISFFINFSYGIDFALLTMVSVIVVTCPCAMGLAIPASISMASSIGIKKGILFKDSKIFELINKTTNIIFDKTGTITQGDMTISDIQTFNNYDKKSVIEIASSVERYSEHPIAKAIVNYLNNQKFNILKSYDFININGQGVRGFLNGDQILVGKKDLLIQNNIIIEESYSNDLTQVFIAYKGLLIGIISLQDKLKDDAIKIIDSFKSKNINIALLSGDRNNVVEKISKLAGIQNYKGEMKPESKAEYIHNLKSTDKIIMMVGDGINDTPAMSASDISVAITSNNDLTNLKADIVILSKDFNSLNDMFNISNKTFNIIKQNIVLSFIYNLIVIPIAVSGNISPLIAAILMPLSSFIVLFNSLKILRGEK